MPLPWLIKLLRDFGLLGWPAGLHISVSKPKIKQTNEGTNEDMTVMLMPHREVLELELTAAVRHHLAKREEDIWSSLYGPRQQQYRENQQLMYLDLPQAKL